MLLFTIKFAKTQLKLSEADCIDNPELLEFIGWGNISYATNTENALIDQPSGVKIEYQIKAINKSGSGIPSNSVSCVLG